MSQNVLTLHWVKVAQMVFIERFNCVGSLHVGLVKIKKCLFEEKCNCISMRKVLNLGYFDHVVQIYIFFYLVFCLKTETQLFTYIEPF